MNLKKNFFLLFFLPLLWACPVFFGEGIGWGQICLDIGQPIDNTTGQIYVNYDVIAQTCTPNVRLNFILGPWNSPEDNTLHNGRTWLQTYNEIVDSLTLRGIQIYGLIGAQISYNSIGDLLINYPSDTQADSAAAAQWEQDYVYNFVKVVDDFKDRVKTFESYNEPNNWDNGWTSVVCAKWFALMLQDIYLNVKYFNGHWGDAAWQVNLISGALFTFDLNDGSQYLNDTYNYGKNTWAWDWTHAQTGSYPLDGIGMHIYCEQGSSDSATVVNAMTSNINAMWNTITTWEGATNKQLWISEFGWESSSVTEQGQADNLRNAFALLLNDNRIGLAIYFTLSDWPGAYWGLYYMGNFSPADRKLAYYEFLNVTNCTATAITTISLEQNPLLLYDAASGTYTIDIRSKVQEARSIELYNMLGENIINSTFSPLSYGRGEGGEVFSLHTSNFPSGIYFLRISSKEKSFCFKIRM